MNILQVFTTAKGISLTLPLFQQTSKIWNLRIAQISPRYCGMFLYYVLLMHICSHECPCNCAKTFAPWTVSLVFITVISIRVLEVYNIFLDINGLVAAGSTCCWTCQCTSGYWQGTCSLRVRQPCTLPGNQLPHCTRCWRTLHPPDGQLPLIISGPFTTLGTWNIGLALQTATK